jgi:hypothetical protein
MYEEMLKLRALARQSRCLARSPDVWKAAALQSLAALYDRQADEIASRPSY